MLGSFAGTRCTTCIRRLALFTFLFAGYAGLLHAAETITSFHSDITVLPDATMRVVETIQVRAEGAKIRRGIYRDFPTRYQDRAGNTINVGFRLVKVMRDGQAEPYHTQSLSNGIRIYIGTKDRFLQVPREYTYTLTYETDRQLGYFVQHDELYWNVTGNGWDFPINRASAAIVLPAGVSYGDIRLEAYTGPSGAKGRDYRSSVDVSGVARFETTAPLGMREGLTIVVMWPKGWVREPGKRERTEYFLRDHADIVAGAIGLLLMLAYYIVVWRKAGRDPRTGTIVPLFEPPAGFSPASMRYVKRMGYDNKAFAVALVNLGVRGQITLSETGDSYTAELTGAEHKDLAPGETALLAKLFAGGKRIEFKQSNHTRISTARSAHKASLQADYEKLYFRTNRGYVAAGIGITMLVLVAMFLLGPGAEGIASLFMSVWLTAWTFAVGFLGMRVVRAFQAVRGFGSFLVAVFSLAFALPFFIGEVAGAGVLFYTTSWPSIALLGLAVVTNIAFWHWMKAPTLAGRRLLDQIDGFGMYLSVAERERLRILNPPERTPELFEKYLPFALALDVEQPWAELFADVLARAQQEGRAYSPAWYRGSNWNASRADYFASSLGGALAGSIASAATAPGSRSGGGGGGSSGGGGGGGGGGGW